LCSISIGPWEQRCWRITDPLLRHLHLSNLMVNCGVIGGLLLVAAI
jgi:hypothetical protein